MPIRFPPAGDAPWTGPDNYRRVGADEVWKVDRVIRQPAIVLRSPRGGIVVIEAGEARAGDYLALIPENEIEAPAGAILPFKGR